jgi:membrane-bound lytic murein transglycosylase D
MKKIHIILAATLIATSLTDVKAQTEEYEIVTLDNGSKEEIAVPESFSLNVDEMLSTYHAKNNISEDSKCNSTDIDIYADKETIVSRLKSMPTIIEMPYNEVVRSFIDRYTQQGRRQVSLLLGISNFYMPIFEQALETYGLPLELKYLPMIESGLNPNAVSRHGASGLWQFMLETGKRYGLTVNSLVDERRDPVKASYAAAHYLSDLYRIFGDWNLVIAAYNCGPERINKAIHRAGGETDYWKLYPYLPKETRGYVPSFIAANYVMNFYCEHNICPMETNLPSRSDTINVKQDVHFEQIAGVIGIDIDQLHELNPQYRRSIVNGTSGDGSLRLPSEYIGKFIDNEDSIYHYPTSRMVAKRSVVDIDDSKEAPAVSTSHHERQHKAKSENWHSRHNGKVTKADAKSSKESRKELSKESRKESRKDSRKGSKKDKADNDRHSKRSRKKAETASSVTIEKGQTLTEIAKKHGTTVEKLKKINKISGSNIRAGKKIKVK